MFIDTDERSREQSKTCTGTDEISMEQPEICIDATEVRIAQTEISIEQLATSRGQVAVSGLIPSPNGVIPVGAPQDEDVSFMIQF